MRDRTSDYDAFFRRLVGRDPYPYQQRLGREPWPELVDVPTGMGKTAGVGLAWLWKRLSGDAETPRRLVYCLPMRSLVEQTHRVFEGWLRELASDFEELPRLHLLMGGEADETWEERPEQPAVLVGTQDMLLSRALNRGYGLSPYRWPMSFGMLHADSLWVFDEVQLMGPGIVTSAQLEGLRRSLPAGPRRARSLWLSATLSREWLSTVDLPAGVPLATLALGPADRERAADRLRSVKALAAARTRLTVLDAKSKARAYLDALAAEVVERHVPASRTLVVLDQVERAQGLYARLAKAAPGAQLLLLHSRFRPPERKAREEALSRGVPQEGQIVVATQVVEAGLDISSTTLFTELCPWSSLVQRCGRCNRYGERNDSADASVLWIDIEVEADEKLALPYDAGQLALCRERLRALRSASPADLPAFDDPRAETAVLRRRDLLALFSTEADLSGFHVDVSPYVRDADDRQVQVFWRSLDSPPPATTEPAPTRDELCSAPLGGVRELLATRPGWRWDPLAPRAAEAKTGAWVRARPSDLFPGLQILLSAAAGGYDRQLGFAPRSTAPVDPVEGARGESPEAGSSDRGSRGAWVELRAHLERVEDRVAEIAAASGLEPSQVDLLRVAARWHDVGKAHPVFQDDLLRGRPDAEARRRLQWAKSDQGRRSDQEEEHPLRRRRRFFRHELASALVLLAHPPALPPEELDLVAYLVAAHHGKVRTALRAWPEEPAPAGDGCRFARGVWEGDRVPPVVIGASETVPETVIGRELLGIIEVGEGPWGRSWGDRVEGLIDEHGPFRLAFLEAVLRAADWRASMEERRQAAPAEEAA